MSVQGIVTDHLFSFLNPETLKQKLFLAEKILKEYEFDTLAFRGMSGAFIGPALAVRMNKQMILVRKPKDDTHSLYKTEGYERAGRYVIVDDFTASGDTKRAIIDAVEDFAPDANFLGLLEVGRLYLDEVENFFALQKGRDRRYPLS